MGGLKSDTLLPIAFVFRPEWWRKNYGLCFERDFFYDPATRVEADLKMRKIMNDCFGGYRMKREIRPDRGETGTSSISVNRTIKSLSIRQSGEDRCLLHQYGLGCTR